MTTYIITELQNANSLRLGETIEAKDLAAAKRCASRMQMFRGTVMKITYKNGAVAIKENGKWTDL